MDDRSPLKEPAAENGTVMDAIHHTLGLQPAKLSKRGSRTRAGRLRVIDRQALDGRTAVAKIYDQLVSAIHNDLGGKDQLSTIELALTEGFAGASIVLGDINARILTGAVIDAATVAMHAQAISAMVRIARRLGTGRRAKPVPSLDDFLEMRERAKKITTGPSITPQPEPEQT
jgi:hypothetical protein